jgi:hypothetical protein
VAARSHRHRRIQGRDRALIVEATLWLALARAAVVFLPFKRLAPHLGEAMMETPTEEPPADAWPDRIGRAVRTASRATPWKTPCLAEAIAAQRMLRRRQIPSTLYLGVTKDGVAIAAHAWLRCGAATVTGDYSRTRFTPVVSFAQTNQDRAATRARRPQAGAR